MKTTNETTVLRWIAYVALGFAGGLCVSEYFELPTSASVFATLLPMVVGGFLAYARGDQQPDPGAPGSEER